jgi:hypothetical protein
MQVAPTKQRENQPTQFLWERPIQSVHVEDGDIDGGGGGGLSCSLGCEGNRRRKGLLWLAF